jgi:uncharacterized membrane protein
MKKDLQLKMWHEDAKNWKLGIFYFNSADHRFFLPKRLKKMGWTLNFARWQSWLILLLTVIFIVFFYNLL